ncbi:Kinetochore-associated protein MTW1 [Cytospora mali]|uniref:Kinetochore-associated protein MTW1 n=1 Tax=Cytospora mali TaxID=578113 RepID=A0A194VP50_CYTMA|nr:Kinetochore-associated protein MTW1 [Valsa mali]
MTAASSDTELLTEHFGYPPVSLLDEIINSINFIAERALASVEQGLLNAPPQQIGFGKRALSKANSKSKRKGKQQQQQPPEDDAPDPTPEEIEQRAHDEISNGTHQLETLLCASIDRNFDKFELYVMRNILCVKPEDRDWMRLGHYEGLNFDNLPPLPNKGGVSEEDDDKADKMDIDVPDTPTVESVNRLRRRLQASQKLNTMLHAEKARNDLLLGELRSLVGRAAGSKGQPPSRTSLGPAAAAGIKQESTTDTKPPFAFLHDRGDLTQADASTPLSTTTAFSLSQLQALRALSTSLSNIMPNLKDGGAAGVEGGGATRRTWRKERVEYVEGAARKHLEDVRGLELGKNGEVRDGEWQGEGRRFASGEVAALEGVVSALGNTGGSRNSGGGGGEEMDEDVIE